MASNHINLADLKIALVHDSLTVPAGAERVLAQLYELFPSATIFAPLYKPEKFPEYKNARVVTSGLNRWSFARNHHQMMIPLLPYFIEQLDLSEYDLVISDSSAVAKGVITRPETIHICYCHTPMRWAWLPYIDKRASSSLLRRLAAHYLRIWDSATVDRVDVWLANSKTSAARVKKIYKRDAKPIYPPVNITGAKVSTKNDGYYLTVGRLIPGNYKRTDIIIDAAKISGISLKIVGDGPMLKQFQAQAKGASNIEFLGRVSDETRNKLYAGCKGFIFAAEEDAGIVPIEAMAYGKPVICYGRGGASETVIDRKTGLHFRQQTADSLALAIQEFERLTFDPEVIHKHAQQFSEARFREEMLEVVTQVLASK